MGVLIEDVIESVKLRGLVPISQNTFTEANLVTLADEELRTWIVPAIFKAREDFFLTSKTVALRNSVSAYGIPQRAIGNTLTALFYVDSSGNKRPLGRYDVTDAYQYAGQTGDPRRFYFKGDEVELLPPAPSAASGSLEMHYYARPSSLILTDSCAKITGVSSAGGVTTFDVNTDLSGDLSAGSDIDFLSAKSPFLLWADEIDIQTISSTQIAVATSSVSDASGAVQPVVGDYICPAGYSNIPMVPIEFIPILSQKVAVRLLGSLGHRSKWETENAVAEAMLQGAISLLRNRIEGSPEKIRITHPLVSAFRGR